MEGLVEIAHGPLVYPPDMERQGLGGWSVTDCAIGADGVAHDCRIVDTSNHGFDVSTLTMASGLRYRATTPGALPIAHFEHSITFKLTRTPTQPVNPEPRWISTSEGCQAWDQRPIAGETASWSGACVNGFVEGPGKFVWRVPHQDQDTFAAAAADPAGRTLRLASVYTGEMRRGLEQGSGSLEAFDLETGASRFVIRGAFQDGRPEGHGTMTASNGISYDGNYHLGRKDGHRITTYPSGTRYADEFRDGAWDGQGRLTWGHGSRAASSAPPRKSACTCNYDERGSRHAPVRPGDDVAPVGHGEPAPTFMDFPLDSDGADFA